MDFGVRSCCPAACVFPCPLPGTETMLKWRKWVQGDMVSEGVTPAVFGLFWELPSSPSSRNLESRILTTSISSLPIPGRACVKSIWLMSIWLNSGRAVDVPVAAWSMTYQVQRLVVAGQTKVLEVFVKTPRSHVLHSMSTCQLETLKIKGSKQV